ncbi:MAG: AAA family ATPase [Burkholderiales bacterium]|jgi:replication-associated recombination protein RarA|nr:AAA family ATPase [Burkholderiales bacterium]
MSRKPTFILYGPQGIGKTTHAETIAKALGCDRILDGAVLDESTFTKAATLRITNIENFLDDVICDENTPHIIITVMNRASLEALVTTLRRVSP